MSYIGNSPGVASQRVTTTLTATAGQTQFTTLSGYILGYVDVYLNGAKLVNGTDFEAITGTYITLFAAAELNDVVELVSYVPRGLTDGYTKAEADAKFLDVTGDTATGTVTIPTLNLSNALGAASGGTGVANNAAATVTSSGNFAYTRTLTAATNVTFPTTGTLATRAGTETLTNKTISSGVLTGTLTAGGGTGTSGQYLKSTGTGVEWATVNALPTQTSNSGKYLTTDGTSASWVTLNLATGGEAAQDGLQIAADYGSFSAPNPLRVDDGDVANWASTWTTRAVGAYGNVSGLLNQTTLSTNAYYSGSSWYNKTNNPLAIYTQASGVHSWSYAAAQTPGTITPTTQMTILANGNVGIGTASPIAKLNVAATNGLFGVANGNTAGGMKLQAFNAAGNANGYLAFEGYSTEYGRFDASGNLGIGRTPGAARLDLEAASGQTKIILRNVGNTVDASTYIAAETGSSGDWANLSLAARHAVVFINNNTERMRLDSSGNLGLGVTPSAWTTFNSTIEVPGGALAGISANQLGVWQNCFYNSSSFKYKSTAGATLYQQSGSAHIWYNAPSGTAGNNITFTQAMTLDSSGNLGIGTTSPAKKLDVYLGTTGTVGQYLRNTTINLLSQIDGTTSAQFGTETSHPLVFLTSNTERARIDTSGNLLMGTTTPLGKITVESSSPVGLLLRNPAGTSYTSLRLYNDTNSNIRALEIDLAGSTYSGALLTSGPTGEQASIGTTGAYPLIFGTNNTCRVVIGSTGNVGVGTTTPTAKLHISVINSDAATTGLLVNTTAAAYPGTSNFITGKFVNNHFGDSWGLWVEANQGSYGACTGIYAKGSIVGAVASGVHGYCEHSNPGGFGTAIGGQFVAHGNLAGGATNGTMIGVLAKCTSVATSVVGYASYALKLETNLGPVSSYGCAYVHNNSQVFILNSNGGISNYSGNNVNLSDQREKKNIVLAGDYLSKICAIPIKTFNYNNDAEGEQVTLGVIAQEVEAIAPEFVSESEWEYGSELNSDGAPISLKRIRKGIYETDMMFAIMKSVQELNAKHEALKLEFEDVSKEQQSIIQQLTARITALEGA